jgi:hypothetical protein
MSSHQLQGVETRVTALPFALDVFPTTMAIKKARQLAKRRRSSAACDTCRMSKTKCNDFRPCTRCTRIGRTESCVTVSSFNLCIGSILLKISLCSQHISADEDTCEEAREVTPPERPITFHTESQGYVQNIENSFQIFIAPPEKSKALWFPHASQHQNFLEPKPSPARGVGRRVPRALLCYAHLSWCDAPQCWPGGRAASLNNSNAQEPGGRALFRRAAPAGLAAESHSARMVADRVLLYSSLFCHAPSCLVPASVPSSSPLCRPLSLFCPSCKSLPTRRCPDNTRPLTTLATCTRSYRPERLAAIFGSLPPDLRAALIEELYPSQPLTPPTPAPPCPSYPLPLQFPNFPPNPFPTRPPTHPPTSARPPTSTSIAIAPLPPSPPP